MTRQEIIHSLDNLIRDWLNVEPLDYGRGLAYYDGYDAALGRCAEQLETLVKRIHGAEDR